MSHGIAAQTPTPFIWGWGESDPKYDRDLRVRQNHNPTGTVMCDATLVSDDGMIGHGIPYEHAE